MGFYFLPTFPIHSLGRCVTSRAAAMAGRAAVGVANCHRHCLCSLTGWTHDGHLNDRRHSVLPSPPLRREIIPSSLCLPLSLFLCFDSFICKSRDKTYGANLQQINSDPGWLSALDIHSEYYDTPSTCLCLKLCLIHYKKCVGKACQHKLSRPVICMPPTRWHNDENYQRRLILCVRRRGCSNVIGVGLLRLFEKEIIIDTQGTVCYLNSKGKSASRLSACELIEWQLSLCRHLIANDNVDLRETQWAKQTLISPHLHH